MKIKQLILTCCSLLFILTSCNNYLDVKPKGKIIPKTAEEYSTILHYWLDEIEKGANATIIPEPDYTSLLEFFAEDLDGTLASSLLIHNYMSVVVSIQIKNVILNCIPLSKTAMLSSAIWKIQNQKWQKTY